MASVSADRVRRSAHRRYWSTRFGSFGENSMMRRPRRLTNAGRMHVGRDVFIAGGARLEAVGHDVWSGLSEARLTIGDGVICEDFITIAVAGSVDIGPGALLASFVFISDHDHVVPTARAERVIDQGLNVSPTRIGARSWIGQGAMILKGVTVGENAVIGAGSIVTKDVPAEMVAVGRPAKVIKHIDDLRR